ncbi:NAD(P)-binding domain-containing protein [Nonomuraea sp. NPDC050310]|uniref:NAD(P)-binding domain-containing protein n=1 Tax=Nonomuraea sp. NPDC050310 TaxID=3154935 RepID=UPI00340D4E96
MTTVDVAVVGAGPYGLSAAAYSIEAGLDTQVFGRPMYAWARHMPVGMLLKSEPFASHLADPAGEYTLGTYCEAHDFPYATYQPTPVERFVDYGRWFGEKAVGDRITPVDVSLVDRQDGEFLLTLTSGEQVRARTVVMAVGFLPFARTPKALAPLPEPLLTHSSQVHDLSEYAGQRVAVVGAGQSAIETACLLREAGAEPHLIARGPELIWNADPVGKRSLVSRVLAPQSGLGSGLRSWVWSERPSVVPFLPAAMRRRIVRTTLGPAGSWWLKERFTGITTTLGARLREARRAGDGVELTLQERSGGGQVRVHADRVIAATGYAVDLRRLDLFAPALRASILQERFAPLLSRRFESSATGLFFVGLAAAPTFGPLMRFVHGTRFAAATLAPALVERVTGLRGDHVRPLATAPRPRTGEPSCR